MIKWISIFKVYVRMSGSIIVVTWSSYGFLFSKLVGRESCWPPSFRLRTLLWTSSSPYNIVFLRFHLFRIFWISLLSHHLPCAKLLRGLWLYSTAVAPYWNVLRMWIARFLSNSSPRRKQFTKFPVSTNFCLNITLIWRWITLTIYWENRGDIG